MSLTHEDFVEIKRVLDDRYVLIEDCKDNQEKVNSKFSNDNTRIELILAEQRQMRKEQKSGFKVNNWLTTAVLGAIIAGLIGFYFFAS